MALFMGMRLLCVLTLLSLFALSLALDPDPARYDRGPVSFDEKAELWYGSDLRAGTASFALRIVDPTVVNESLTSTWIGVGVSESTSGSMLGGDILSAQFTDDKNCLATDRYVPFFAYPLIESTADAPSAFPFADDCQDDGSWVVHRCERDFTTGEMLIEVSRPLEAHDTQDRSIEEGPVSMIYSYGNEFQYHGGNRGAMQVTLFLDRNDPDSKPPAGEPELPDDVDGSFEVLATNYEVPSNMSTTYSCTTQRVDLGGNGQRMIVAVEPVLDAPIDMVHHFTLYLCRNEEYAELTKETTTCMSLNGINGPLANPKAGCSTFVYGCKSYKRRISRFGCCDNDASMFPCSFPYLCIHCHSSN